MLSDHFVPLRSYATTALRSLRRQGLYAAVNILGLALGMASCVLILLFVRHELSFDTHHPAPQRTYRLVLDSEPRVPSPLVSIVRDEVPGVDRAAIFRRPFRPMIVRGDERRYEAVHVAEQGFFQILSFRFLYGDPETALQEAGSMVVTPAFARRYFEGDDVVGETLLWDGNIPYRITGVVEIPATSHLAFEAVISYKTMLAREGFGYSELWRYRQSAYVVLAPRSDPHTTAARILNAVERRLGADKRQLLEADGLALQPVTDIRLRSRWPEDTARTASRSRLLILSVIAAVILTMGCVNFTNLATARSVRRGREVGLRKVVGARRHQLILQFLGESVLLGFVSLAVAVGAAWAALPAFSAFLQVQLVLDASPTILRSIAAIGLLGGALAGAYPALVLSRAPPAVAFRASERRAGQGVLRKTLVTFQFSVAIGLIAVTLLVHRQMDFVRTTDLGFDREQIVLMHTGYPGVRERRGVLIERLLAHPAISHATCVRHAPAEVLNQRGTFHVDGIDGEVSMPFTSADPGFPGLFGVPLLAGRDHHEPHDRRREETYLVTRSAAHALGFESPEQILGRHVGYTYRGRSRGEGRVVGVLEDFRFETLHVPAGPLVITNQWGVVYVAVRLQDVRAGLDHLRETWDGVNPDWPLDYRFLDDNFEAAYRTETRLGSVLTGFCFIAVVVAGIGVFALAAYTAQQRTREVGIRKVLGASSSSVVVLLAMEFARLGAIAGVVAAPLAYLGMTRWLERFADRVEPGPDVFIGSVAVVLLLALVATGGHALRAAWADPVQALRHE